MDFHLAATRLTFGDAVEAHAVLQRASGDVEFARGFADVAVRVVNRGEDVGFFESHRVRLSG